MRVRPPLVTLTVDEPAVVASVHGPSIPTCAPAPGASAATATATASTSDRRHMARPFHRPADNAPVTARRLLIVLATLLGVAAPADALILAAPVGPTPGGCVRDIAAAPVRSCATARGLGSPAALAIAGKRLLVAAADDGTVTALDLRGSRAVARPSPQRPAHVPGLTGVDALAVSPDARDAYAGSTDDRAVVGLRAATLDPIAGGCVARRATASCTGSGLLASIGGLAMSPDGLHLYAATFAAQAGADRLVTLARSRRDGTLRVAPQAPCVQSLGRASAVCPIRAPGLEGLSAVIVTADGRFVYTASPVSSAVVALRRNRLTGRLTPLRGAGACLRDASTTDAGDDGCATGVPGLRGARSLTLTDDGRTVIVTAGDPGSVVALTRNRTTGTLTMHAGGCLTAAVVAGCQKVDGLRGAQQSVAIDGGRKLLVAAQAANALVAVGLRPGRRSQRADRPAAHARHAQRSGAAGRGRQGARGLRGVAVRRRRRHVGS